MHNQVAREGSIQDSVIKTLKSMGLLVRKKHGGAFGLAGEPDIYGAIPPSGRAYGIELKRPGEEPTKLQRRRLQEWANAGAIAGWASSVDGVLSILSSDIAPPAGKDYEVIRAQR